LKVIYIKTGNSLIPNKGGIVNIFRRREITKEKFVCVFCDKIFDTKIQLREHLLGECDKGEYKKVASVKEALLQYNKAKEFILLANPSGSIVKRTRKTWTHKEVNQLKGLWGYYTVGEIAKILNRTVRSVAGKIEKLQMQKILLKKNMVWSTELSLPSEKEIIPSGKNISIENLFEKLPVGTKISKGKNGFFNGASEYDPVKKDYSIRFRGKGLRETLIKLIGKIDDYNRKKLW